MKKVININFQGRVIPIEETAYETLKQYIDSLNRYFANEEGKDEIINDIEGRIAELFGEALKKGSTCITEDDVANIIASMGRPEDFEDDETKVHSQLNDEAQAQSQSSSSSQQSSTHQSTEHKRLYRDENNKVIGGVCSGLANYFNIDPVIMRIIFLVTFFGAGFGFIVYLILWIVVPSSASTVIGAPRKRLFRDTDEKVIAGVCSGLARYFNISVIIPRLIFIIPFLSFVFHPWNWGWWGFPHFLSLSFSPTAFFTYVILWMVIPEAITTADKLEMKGERVDLNNIKTTIQSDLEGFGKRAKEWGKEMGEKGKEFGEEMRKTFSEKGKEFGQTAQQASKQFVSETAPVIKKSSRGLGDVIAIIFKIFAYFIIGVVIFSIFIALFVLGITFTGLTPLQAFILDKGWEEIFAWGTLFFFIWVPVVGIITWVIRRLAGSKSNSKLLRYSFLAFWAIGWVCLIFLIVAIGKNFKYENSPVEENISLVNPKVNKLEFVAPVSPFKYRTHRWFKIEPFTNFVDDDSVYVNNVHFRIVKSNNDSFKITVLKLANGYSRQNANQIASSIEYNPTQTDSVITMPLGIQINKTNKFRNQHVVVTVAVPVGKRIKISQDIWDKGAGGRISFWNDEDNWDDEWGNEESGWSTNVEYIQTEKGLKRTDNNEQSLNDDNGVMNDSKKNKEELKKQREEKLKELKELDKQLQPDSTDNSRYHYQQQKAPAKKEIGNQAFTRKDIHPFLTNDLLFLRFSI